MQLIDKAEISDMNICTVNSENYELRKFPTVFPQWNRLDIENYYRFTGSLTWLQFKGEKVGDKPEYTLNNKANKYLLYKQDDQNICLFVFAAPWTASWDRNLGFSFLKNADDFFKQGGALYRPICQRKGEMPEHKFTTLLELPDKKRNLKIATTVYTRQALTKEQGEAKHRII